MHRMMMGLALLATAAPLYADQVVDDFESDTNPNQWGWTNNGGGAFTIVPDGGNPGAWLDSGVPYFSDHPNLTALPPAGTALRAALDSGTLHTASIDLQRLDTSAVTTCHPVYDLPSMFTLELIDTHTDASTIEAHTTDGPASPGGTSFPWTSVSFTIPSEATGVPTGWVLNAPPELNYTWTDLMHNIDGIRFFVLSPDDFTYDACWNLGADNIVVSYGTVDKIFADGFDGAR
ncbi:MAG: hypothetical protein ACHP7D_07595 [Lysobacterales bacterium]